jgi:hypothetical protein
MENISKKNIVIYSDDEKKLQYKIRINAIKEYYGISEEAAIYIYFRRKRNYPWKKKNDPGYLFWNAKLQNALIEADNIIGFDWVGLEYGKEQEVLLSYGIDIDKQSQNIHRIHKEHKSNNKIEKYLDDNGDEWTYIKKREKNKRYDINKKNNTNKNNEAILRSIGLLPKSFIEKNK